MNAPLFPPLPAALAAASSAGSAWGGDHSSLMFLLFIPMVILLVLHVVLHQRGLRPGRVGSAVSVGLWWGLLVVALAGWWTGTDLLGGVDPALLTYGIMNLSMLAELLDLRRPAPGENK